MNSTYRPVTAATITGWAGRCREEMRRAEAAEVAPAVRYCAGCGEPEGSPYAKHCCTEDQMIDDGGEEE